MGKEIIIFIWYSVVSKMFLPNPSYYLTIITSLHEKYECYFFNHHFTNRTHTPHTHYTCVRVCNGRHGAREEDWTESELDSNTTSADDTSV